MQDALQPLETMENHGVFARIMDGMAPGTAKPQTVMIDATSLKAHRTAVEPAGKKGDPDFLIGRTKGDTHTKFHVLTAHNGKPLSFFMTTGQLGDWTGAVALLNSFSKGPIVAG